MKQSFSKDLIIDLEAAVQTALIQFEKIEFIHNTLLTHNLLDGTKRDVFSILNQYKMNQIAAEIELDYLQQLKKVWDVLEKSIQQAIKD